MATYNRGPSMPPRVRNPRSADQAIGYSALGAALILIVAWVRSHEVSDLISSGNESELRIDFISVDGLMVAVFPRKLRATPTPAKWESYPTSAIVDTSVGWSWHFVNARYGQDPTIPSDRVFVVPYWIVTGPLIFLGAWLLYPKAAAKTHPAYDEHRSGRHDSQSVPDRSSSNRSQHRHRRTSH